MCLNYLKTILHPRSVEKLSSMKLFPAEKVGDRCCNWHVLYTIPLQATDELCCFSLLTSVTSSIKFKWIVIYNCDPILLKYSKRSKYTIKMERGFEDEEAPQILPY